MSRIHSDGRKRAVRRASTVLEMMNNEQLIHFFEMID